MPVFLIVVRLMARLGGVKYKSVTGVFRHVCFQRGAGLRIREKITE